MSRGPEFVEDQPAPDAGGHPDDLLHPAHAAPGRYARAVAVLQETVRRHPGLRRGCGAVVATAVVVAAVLAVVPRDTIVPGRGSTVAEAVAPVAPSAASTVRELAGTTGRLTDYVRQTSAAGACPTVRVGSSPTRLIVARVRAALPDFTVTDVASTLDEFTGLCSVRLRARASNHAVLALVVSAPSVVATTPALPFVLLRVGTDPNADGTSTVWVSATTVQHWTVVVGAVADQDALPSSAPLLSLAQQDLTW